MSERKKILLVNEASFLATGFSTYGMEILKRLHATGKYEIGELACYGKPSDPRFQSLPWKAYPAMPDDQDQKALQVFHSSPLNQFGEWIFDEVLIDFMPDIVIDIRDWWMLEFEQRSVLRDYYKWCFPAGTQISLPNGQYKTIEKITCSDDLITHTNRVRQTNKTMRRKSNRLIEITLNGFNIPTTATKEHPALVYIKHKNKSGRQWDKETNRYTSNKDTVNVSEATWIDFQYIEPGDYVFKPILFLPEPDKTVDENLAFYSLLGYFLSDGCAEKENNRINFYFSSNEGRYVRDVVSKLNSITTDNDAVIDKHKPNMFLVRVCDEYFSSKFKLCYDENGKKFIPSCLYPRYASQAHQLLKGLIRGDGSICEHNGYKTIEYCTNSEILARQIVDLLAACYKITSTLCKKVNGNGIIYKISISDPKGSKLLPGYVYQNEAIQKLEFNKKFDKSPNWISDDGYIVYRVKSKKIIDLPGEIPVYNMEVDEDNSYIATFAVHNCIMPTVDGSPQQPRWLDTYSTADHVLSYSHFGRNELMKDPRIAEIFYEVASPGVDLEMFFPLHEEDKKKLRKLWGIQENLKIILFVARNQKRKLFPRLMQAFSRCIEKYKSKAPGFVQNLVLYIHTSYPDVGWDIPEAIRRSGCGNKIIMSYLCDACHRVFPSYFTGMFAYCRHCGKRAAHLPNTNQSVDRQALAQIYQMADLYIQATIAEGFGMPVAEALACAQPVLTPTYSACGEFAAPNYPYEGHGRDKGGIPLKIRSMYVEPETMQERALFDIEDCATKIYETLASNKSFNSEKRKERKKGGKKNLSQKKFDRETKYMQLRQNARKVAEQYYDWDKTAAIWEKLLDQIEIKDRKETWLHPQPRKHHIRMEPAKAVMNNAEFVEFCISEIAGFPDRINSFEAHNLIQGLDLGMEIQNDKPSGPLTREMVYEKMKNLGEHKNQMEELRVQKLKGETNKGPSRGPVKL